MSELSNQVVVITGALGNVGSAAVRSFTAAGAKTVLVDRSVERLQETWGDLAEAGHLLLGGVDLTDPASVSETFEKARAELGRLDVLFNTVGAFRGGRSLHEEDLATWDLMMNVNLRTTLLTCRAVVPHMKRQGHGRIINTASRNGFVGAGDFAAYSAAKSAVLRLTESLAEEVKDAGVNVNCVVPGVLDTPQNRAANPGSDFSRWVEPAAVADAVVSLASDAGRAITGAAIPIYGRL